MPKTVAEYLAAQPPAARRVLKRVRTVIKQTLPGAEEVISYGIPAFRQHRRIVIYFAGWKEHLSLYPISKPLEKALKKELGGYELSGRGTVRFELTERLPVHLISAIAAFRSREVAAKLKPKKR